MHWESREVITEGLLTVSYIFLSVALGLFRQEDIPSPAATISAKRSLGTP